MQPKPRIPPFRELPILLNLTEEKRIRDEKQELKEKRKAEQGNKSDSEDENNLNHREKEDPHKYDVLEMYDFRIDEMSRTHIVNYDEKEISLYEIFNEYGTTARPKENPKHDPKPPPPREKKPIQKTQEVVGEDGEIRTQIIEVEEPEEEVFIPPCDKFLYYDFDTHNGKDPILLALMIKGE
mmetsp:Transcript_17768/g.30082  ORF Transcript_17768/g.30082 Transcript_17768/m.30082 type:complete len:182 (+) Transcript_17768:326-871(+)